MVAILPEIDPNALYSVQETMKILGIKRSTLYAYDKSGIIEHEIRCCNGRRVFRGNAIIKCFRTV